MTSVAAVLDSGGVCVGIGLEYDKYILIISEFDKNCIWLAAS